MPTVTIVLIVLAAAYIIIDPILERRKARKNLMQRIRNSWGKRPEPKYKAGDLESIATYHLNHRNKSTAGFAIDDVTWRDLELDDLFIRVNCTETTAGEETLYRLMREPSFDMQVLETRRKLAEFFQKNKESRELTQVILSKLGKKRQVNVTQPFFRNTPAMPWRARLYKILAIIALVSPVLFFAGTGIAVLVFVISLSTNMFVYYSRRFDIAADLAAMNYIVGLVQHTGRLIDKGLRAPELSEFKIMLASQYGKVKGIGKRGFYLFFFGTGSFMDMVAEYIRIILLKELIDYEWLCNAVSEHQGELIDLYDSIGLLDSLISIASFRESIPYYCEPKLEKLDLRLGRRLEFDEIYHPVVADPIPNSLSTDQPVLITGSNASGKSTFLKAVAVNAIFAQAFCTCMARRYSSPMFAVFTSMAMRDNIINGESYFIAEIKSIKRILDYSNKGIPCLCLIDEVLRGTNTIERIAASSQVLLQLAEQNYLCIAATHDIELTNLLESNYRNMHFEESITGDGILFDYRLRDGKANTRNAIKLLHLMGYSDAIVSNAEKRADHFARHGYW